MLKGSQSIAFALTLASLFVGISTNNAYAKQSTGSTVDVVVDSGGTPSDAKCRRTNEHPCPYIGPGGNTPPSRRDVLNNVTPFRSNGTGIDVKPKMPTGIEFEPSP